MKIYTFGKEDAPVLLLLPGTCCHWKGNFEHVIPLLEGCGWNGAFFTVRRCRSGVCSWNLQPTRESSEIP